MDGFILTGIPELFGAACWHAVSSNPAKTRKAAGRSDVRR
jgi:hypothetical protein